LATEKRPIEVDDLYKLVHIEDPRISPDGKWVAFVRVSVDKMENGYTRNIWLIPTDMNGKPFQLTRGNKDSNPRWSPDGKSLMFVSSRTDKPQVYLLSISTPGGEARMLTSMENGAMGANWSPDGDYFAYLSPLNAEERGKEDSGEKDEPPSDKLESKHRKERKHEVEKNRQDPYFTWRIPYRAGTSFLGDRFAQIYIVPVNESSDSDEIKPRRLTDVDADHEPPQWSKDGKYLYTSRQVDPMEDEPFRNSGIYRISVEDGASALITDDDYSSFSPLISPDGTWLAYARIPTGEGESPTDSITRLTVMPSNGGSPRDLNLDYDRSLVSYDWSPDSQSVVATMANEGDTPVLRFSVDDRPVEKIATNLSASEELNVGPNGEITFTAGTPVNPGELYWLPAKSDTFTPITDFNRKFLDEVIVQETIEMRFANSQGQEIQGWYLLPVGYEEGKQYPLALNIHGGPHAMWSAGTRTMFHEWQLHSARGYAVFFCNPRGSDGYGESYLKALHGAWGDVAFDDVMAGVDAFLEKGFVDKSRMAVTGGSYGGYMTAWVVGHTDRFASAVTQRGVYNLTSFYGTSDVPSLISYEFDVEPWEDPELLWKHSPLAYAHKIKTPLLIIHSENDYRVPIEQGEQLFAFVRRSGGTVEMWRYPRDGHELSRSGEQEHRASRLTKMVEWFDKHCMRGTS
jgi:dipeptidyl aminopeptidase/acylaminoacyl peptidase